MRLQIAMARWRVVEVPLLASSLATNRWHADASTDWRRTTGARAGERRTTRCVRRVCTRTCTQAGGGTGRWGDTITCMPLRLLLTLPLLRWSAGQSNNTIDIASVARRSQPPARSSSMIAVNSAARRSQPPLGCGCPTAQSRTAGVLPASARDAPGHAHWRTRRRDLLAGCARGKARPCVISPLACDCHLQRLVGVSLKCPCLLQASQRTDCKHMPTVSGYAPPERVPASSARRAASGACMVKRWRCGTRPRSASGRWTAVATGAAVHRRGRWRVHRRGCRHPPSAHLRARDRG